MSDTDGAIGVPHSGWTYKHVCKLFFDPSVQLPVLAVIYDKDIEDAEACGATHIAWVMQGIARTKGRTLGYHEREILIPLAVAKMMAFPDYGAYLADRAVRLASGEKWPD